MSAASTFHVIYISFMFNNPFAAIAVGCIAGFSIVGLHANIVDYAASIDEAFAKQCATQDWSAHQHDAHVEYCLASGHAVD